MSLFIAEVKTKSPFGFESKHSWSELFELAIEHGDAVAVHTDPRWDGSMGTLEDAADELGRKKLLIAKGIHPFDDEIREALFVGANLVTVVGRVPPPELAPVCIWEPTFFHSLVADGDLSQKIMWNQRDLKTGKPRESVWNIKDARRAHLGWLCQASFIEKPEDVNPKVDAFIVGNHLPEYIKRAEDV